MSVESMTTEICSNCEAYGRVENGIITLPCSSCAKDNGYEWNGRRCYGVTGNSNGYEATLEELIVTYVIVVRPRYIEDPTGLDGLTPDEYILNNLIPDEGKNLYKEYMNQLNQEGDIYYD